MRCILVQVVKNIYYQIIQITKGYNQTTANSHIQYLPALCSFDV